MNLLSGKWHQIVSSFSLIFLLLMCPSDAFFSLRSRTVQHPSARSNAIPFILLPALPNHRRQSPLSPRMLLESAAATTTSDVLTRSSMFLVRIVFLRAMAFVYGVAFLVALRQNKALIGDNGITPARYVLDAAEKRGKEKKERRLQWRASDVSRGTRVPTTNTTAILEQLHWSVLFSRIAKAIDKSPRLIKLREVLWDRSDKLGRPVTTLLWLAKDRQKLNPWLDGIAVAGLTMSATVFMLGAAANVPLLLALWICQRSLMSIGGPWYGYGWEPQLAELGFHALFLVPVLSLSQLAKMPPPDIVVWTLRWFLFRIMMGAGLIKLRSGDKKWKDLTTMNYFYETQPVPSPVTRYLHWMPGWWHKGEVLINHFVELIAPWLLIIPGLPATWRRAGGLIQLIFQAILVGSGNLSFLNWLTMVPAILCLDDAFVGGLFSLHKREAAVALASASQLSSTRKVVSTAFLLLILQLSIPVVRNLMSKRQIMNSSFDPLRLVNTYGAFGTVSEERKELVISAATNWEGPWKEYEFKVKPVSVTRPPRFISPYHYRLDWQMWIAATARGLDKSPWMFTFLAKLLRQEPEVRDLIAVDPFEDSDEHPKYIRVDMYRYRFHKKQPGEQNPPYWEREMLGRVYPRSGVATIDSLKDEIKKRLPDRPLS